MRDDLLSRVVVPGTDVASVVATLGEPNADFGPGRLGYTLGPRGGTGVEYYYLVILLATDGETVASASIVSL